MTKTKVDRKEGKFSWWWVGIFLAGSAAAGVGFAVVLWGNDTEDHRNAVDTSWKVAAAVLAVLAALVTVRRLRLSEAEHQRQLTADAAKQVIDHATLVTNLSSKASEQLGSEKAAVRIGGLTDLERLAQTYPELRQTVVDRICAYLRGPYLPPPAKADSRDGGTGDVADRADEQNVTLADEDIAARHLELDVRRTAQQILRRHLQAHNRDGFKSSAFWPKMSLDLRDAALHEFDFSGCRVSGADFEGATFYRNAMYSESEFDDLVDFEDATFLGVAFFDLATFAGSTYFRGAEFLDSFNLHAARFEYSVDFEGAIFHSRATFDETEFVSTANFARLSCKGDVFLEKASFAREVAFDDTVFGRNSRFANVKFGASSSFEGVEFVGRADFADATFAKEPTLDRATSVYPKAGHVWPAKWHLEDGTLVRRDF